MKALLFLLVLPVVTSHMHDEFLQFIETYDRNYATYDEYAARYQIFQENVQLIAHLNEKYLGYSYFKVNKFTDLNLQQFRQKVTGNPVKIVKDYNACDYYHDHREVSPPNILDWRTTGHVTPVRDQ
jgi:C1A family cysteine protease